MTESVHPWWESLYDDWLADVLLTRGDAAEVTATLGFLTEALRLEAGQRVFDQCCGIGSLSVPLAQAGYRVQACDLMPGYIERARSYASQQQVQVESCVADAFHFVAAPCQAAFNWWTSFGYAPSDTENLRMLRCAYDSLLPGGRFALDFMNVPGVLRSFVPRVITQRQTPRGNVTLVRESEIDLRAMAMTKRWTYHLPDGSEKSHPSWVRMYLPHELEALLRRAGFEDVALYGDVDLSAIALDSPRCIAVARRPV